MNLEELSSFCMQMISTAGEGRFCVHEALKNFLENNFESANSNLEKAELHLSEAHRIQFENLMVRQANGDDLPFSMLLFHAMDLLMVSTSEYDLLRIVVNKYLRE